MYPMTLVGLVNLAPKLPWKTTKCCSSSHLRWIDNKRATNPQQTHRDQVLVLMDDIYACMRWIPLTSHKEFSELYQSHSPHKPKHNKCLVDARIMDKCCLKKDSSTYQPLSILETRVETLHAQKAYIWATYFHVQFIMSRLTLSRIN